MPSLLGFLGMTLIGTASLWRAYRTTIGLYQGQSTVRKGRPAPAVASPASARKPGALLLEARLPGLSEPVSAIALGGLRSLLRSPEAKMMLLTPVLMGAIFGSMLLKVAEQRFRTRCGRWSPSGRLGSSLFGMLQLMANQFGFDRDGFRVFVLCAAPRRDILLGKNLAFAPLALGMAAILLIDRAGGSSPAVGPLPGDVPAVRLDVSAVLHLDELAFDLRAHAHRRRFAEAHDIRSWSRCSCKW